MGGFVASPPPSLEASKDEDDVTASDDEDDGDASSSSADEIESINEVLQKAPKNFKLTYHEIQKDIVNAIAHETSKAIIKDLDNGFFSILVDELHDILVKEQMVLVLRYVNKKRIIIERFLGIVHVASTTTLSLKYAIECLLCEHNLSLSKLRGQGYDGASNIQGSCKRRNALRDAQFAKIKEELENGVRRSGQGLNQEINLKCPGDKRWRLYYETILNLFLMFSAVVDVLEIIEEDGLSDQKACQGVHMLEVSLNWAMADRVEETALKEKLESKLLPQRLIRPKNFG
ncbi:uncharacterized protein LOC142628798 [Castanea sativa]|uniref:uncharacterized protein LOC142628798 n=1 Tax=Castanea sativa TaxID=21020 RepID=UPI003F65157E